jgi:lysozyme
MTLQPSPAIIAFIQGYEKCARQVGAMYHSYLPTPNDRWTIGWGTTGPDVGPSTRWTKAECDARFARDLTRFGNNVAAHLGSVPTTQGQYDAMVSLAYNIGIGAFSGSTLLRKHRDGDFGGAAEQFERWNRQAGKVLNGLTKRRAGEAAIYRGEP